jgi:hypothetical protein
MEARTPVAVGYWMDFLNFVIAIDEELNIPIAESDYPKLVTLEGCIEFLAQKQNRAR